MQFCTRRNLAKIISKLTLSLLKEARQSAPTGVTGNPRGLTMPTNVGNDLLVLLSDAARQMRTYADQVAQAHGLTRAQWIILARLERKADCRRTSSPRSRKSRR